MAATERICAHVLAVIAGACTTGPATDLVVPDADAAVFKTQVYPILLRDCAFSTCHGNADRFFAVFGPGRARLDPKTGIYDPATPTEMALAYTRARSMLLGPDGPESSLFLRKPIPTDEGGAGHKGDDAWGRSVYASVQDARYTTLFRWATGTR